MKTLLAILILIPFIIFAQDNADEIIKDGRELGKKEIIAHLDEKIRHASNAIENFESEWHSDITKHVYGNVHKGRLEYFRECHDFISNMD